MRGKLLIILISLAFSPRLAEGQEDIDSLQPKKAVVFRDDKAREQVRTIVSIAPYIGTRGWRMGINALVSRRDFAERGSYSSFGMSIGNIRHRKEINQRTNFANPNGGFGFVKYGKANTLYPICFSFGRRTPLGDEALYKGIEITFEYKVGALLGVLVPYPIESIFGLVSEYNASTAIYYEDFQNIQFSPGSFSQFSFDKIEPGFRAEGNFCFANYAKKRFATTLLVGANLDIFSKKMAIFWDEDSGPIFFQVHLGAEFGVRRER